MMQVKESKSQDRLVCVVLDFLDHVCLCGNVGHDIFHKGIFATAMACFAQQTQLIELLHCEKKQRHTLCNDELSNNVIQGCSLVHKSCLVASGLHGTGDCSSHVDDEVNVKFKLGGGGEWVFGCGLKGLLLCLLFFLEVSLTFVS